MIKHIVIIILIAAAIILVGTFPLSILEIIFRAIATAFGWLAKVLNFFGWNGLLV